MIYIYPSPQSVVEIRNSSFSLISLTKKCLIAWKGFTPQSVANPLPG